MRLSVPDDERLFEKSIELGKRLICPTLDLILKCQFIWDELTFDRLMPQDAVDDGTLGFFEMTSVKDC